MIKSVFVHFFLEWPTPCTYISLVFYFSEGLLTSPPGRYGGSGAAGALAGPPCGREPDDLVVSNSSSPDVGCMRVRVNIHGSFYLHVLLFYRSYEELPQSLPEEGIYPRDRNYRLVFIQNHYVGHGPRRDSVVRGVGSRWEVVSLYFIFFRNLRFYFFFFYY